MSTLFNVARTALTTSAAKILSANPYAKFREIRNLDSNIVVYFGNAGVTSATGYPLYPGERFVMDAAITTADLYMVAASGTPNIAAVEY